MLRKICGQDRLVVGRMNALLETQETETID